jgi:putative two-component system response regulator
MRADEETLQDAPAVLVVDDNSANRELLAAYIGELDCEVRTASTGRVALTMIETEPPDVVLLDVHMPDIDGYDVCRRIRSIPGLSFMPVIMITALDQTEDRVKALEWGADDFMTKPVQRVELVARVRSSLRLKALHDTLDSAEQVIYALAAAVEAKDLLTERHTRRVGAWARHVGACWGLSEPSLHALYRGGIVHDIGKIGVPEAILGKPGPLEGDEVTKMQAHPIIGESIVAPLRSASRLLPIIRHHHERFDGHGYPDSLQGTEIPLLARIISVCDAFDALINDRPYRNGIPVADAVEVLREGAGTQWDPEVVDIFVREIPALRRLDVA